MFVQMGILALLAVFTGEAAGSTGVEFALVYVAYMAVLTWLWYSVRRRDTEEFMALAGRYITGMLITIGAMLLTTLLPEDLRILVWGIITIAWLVFMLLANSVTFRET